MREAEERRGNDHPAGDCPVAPLDQARDGPGHHAQHEESEDHLLDDRGFGTTLGVAAALAGSRLLSSLMFGVTPRDTATFLGVAVGVMAFATGRAQARAGEPAPSSSSGSSIVGAQVAGLAPWAVRIAVRCSTSRAGRAGGTSPRLPPLWSAGRR